MQLPPLRALLVLIVLVVAALAVSGCVQAVSTPTATLPSEDAQEIVLESPPAGATVSSPLVLRGSTKTLPVGGTVAYRVFDQQGTLLTSGTLPVLGPPDGPGRFDGVITFTAPAGPGRIELLDINPADGAIRASAVASVVMAGSAGVTPVTTVGIATLVTISPTPAPFATTAPLATAASTPAATQQSITIETPPSGTQVGSPMTITGRTAIFPPGGQLNYRVRDQAGNAIGQGTVAVTPASNGAGAFTAVITFVEPASGGPISVELTQTNVATNVLVVNVAPPQVITFDSPPPGTQVGSPMTITGRTTRYPYQGNLSYRVFNSQSVVIGQGVFAVNGTPGNPASFVAELTFAVPTAGEVRIELSDEDAATGRVAARQILVVRFGSAPLVATSIPVATPTALVTPVGFVTPLPTPPPPTVASYPSP